MQINTRTYKQRRVFRGAGPVANVPTADPVPSHAVPSVPVAVANATYSTSPNTSYPVAIATAAPVAVPVGTVAQTAVPVATAAPATVPFASPTTVPVATAVSGPYPSNGATIPMPAGMLNNECH